MATVPSPFPVVCTSPWTPMVFTDDIPENQALWTGYAIDLYRAVATKMNWNPDSWKFDSLDWDVMESRLDNGSCAIAAAGVDISVDNITRGWLNSYAIYTRAFAILTTLDIQQKSLFAFLAPFRFDLWIAFLLTSLLTACLIWAFEVYGHRSAWMTFRRASQMSPADRKQAHKKPLPSKTASLIHREEIKERGIFKGSFEFFYQVIGKAINIVDTITVRTLASKVLLLFWGLGVVVVLATYSASLTANLTVSRVAGGVNSIADLPGKAVGTWEPYVPQLKTYNIFATPYQWNNAADEKIMVRDLLAKKVVAFVLDNVFVRYLAMNSGCKLQQVSTDFQYVDIAITFAAGTDVNLINQINDALVALKEEGVHEILEKRYFARDSHCTSGGLKSSSNSISFTDLQGLWVIGGAWYGACILIFLLTAFYHYRSIRKQVRPDHLALMENGQSGLKRDHCVSEIDSPVPTIGVPVHGMMQPGGYATGGLLDAAQSTAVTPVGATPRPHTSSVRFSTTPLPSGPSPKPGSIAAVPTSYARLPPLTQTQIPPQVPRNSLSRTHTSSPLPPVQDEQE